MSPRHLILLGIVGCAPPPPAPEDLDAVAAFLFEQHHADAEVLADGFVNLRAWFEADADPEDNGGFELRVPLTQEAVDAVDASAAWTHPDTKPTRSTEGMAGAAAGTVGAHAIEDYTWALVGVPQDALFPDMFVEWSRTWRLCDGDTFAAKGCEHLEGDEQMVSAFGFGLRSEGEAYNQYRWIPLPDGQWAMSHRNWQIYPPDVSSNLLEVVDQYYLNAFVPSTDGDAVFRLQATWAVFGDAVPRDFGLSLTANSMADNSQALEAWLDENGPMP